MRLVIVCLLIFIIGYNIGYEQVEDSPNTDNQQNAAINNDSVFESGFYQISNLEVDSVAEIKQTKILYKK